MPELGHPVSMVLPNVESLQCLQLGTGMLLLPSQPPIQSSPSLPANLVRSDAHLLGDLWKKSTTLSSGPC